MPKTLPTVITERKGGDWERILLVCLTFRDEDDPEGNPVWQVLCWATREITVGFWREIAGQTRIFSGGALLEKGFSNLEEAVDVEDGGNVAQLSGFSFRIANPQYSGELRFDEFMAGKRPESGTCELWLALASSGESTVNYLDLLLLKKGTVKDMKYDYGEYTIEVEDAWKKRHKDLLTMVNRENYPNVSESALGKTMPLLYGYFLDGDTKPSYCDQEYGFPLILIDEVENKYLVSQNNLVEFDTYLTYLGVPGGALGQVAVFDSDTLTMTYLIFGSLGTLPGTGWTLTSGRPTTVALPRTEIWGCCQKQFTTRGSQSDLPGDFDVKNAIDDWDYPPSSYITLTAGMKAYFQARFPDNVFEIIQRTRVKLIVQFYNPSAVLVTGKIKYRNPSFS